VTVNLVDGLAGDRTDALSITGVVTNDGPVDLTVEYDCDPGATFEADGAVTADTDGTYTFTPEFPYGFGPSRSTL